MVIYKYIYVYFRLIFFVMAVMDNFNFFPPINVRISRF